jgi:hypothetical protein
MKDFQDVVHGIIQIEQRFVVCLEDHVIYALSQALQIPNRQF